jgi:hypothetical protein
LGQGRDLARHAMRAALRQEKFLDRISVRFQHAGIRIAVADHDVGAGFGHPVDAALAGVETADQDDDRQPRLVDERAAHRRLDGRAAGAGEIQPRDHASARGIAAGNVRRAGFNRLRSRARKPKIRRGGVEPKERDQHQSRRRRGRQRDKPRGRKCPK